MDDASPRGWLVPSEPAASLALESWDQDIWRECGAAIQRWLDHRGFQHQQIKQLRAEELAGMAWACLSQYEDLREEMRKRLSLPLSADETKPQYLDLLLGA